MEIFVKQKKYTATNNTIRIYFDLEVNSRSKNLHLTLKSTKSYSSKVINPEGYIKSGRHGVDVTFYNTKSGWKFITVQCIKLTKSGTSIAYSKKFKIQVLNLDSNYKRPSLSVGLLNFSPEFSTNKQPNITLELDIQVKGSTQNFVPEYSAELFINENTVLQLEKKKDRKISYWPDGSLIEGTNTVEIVIYFDQWPEKVYRFTRTLYVELRPPEVHFSQLEIHTNNAIIELEMNVLKRGIDIDWSTVELKSRAHLIPLQPVVPSDWVALRPGEKTDGTCQAKLHLIDPLWEGVHNLTLTINDILGRKSNQALCNLFLDQSPPFIIKSSIASGAIVGVGTSEVSFEISDIKRAPVLLKTCEIITGVGRRNAQLLSAYGIDTIFDLSLLNPFSSTVPGISRTNLRKFIYQSKIIANTRIPREVIQHTGVITVEEFVDTPFTSTGDWHGIDIKKMKTSLQELYLVFDISILRSLNLTEFISLEGSNLDDFNLTLNENSIDAKVLDEGNAIVANLPKLAHGENLLELTLSDKCGNINVHPINFFADGQAPHIVDRWPINNSYINKLPLAVAIKYYDQHLGVDPESIQFIVDGKNINSQCRITESGVSVSLDELSEGKHHMLLKVADKGGNTFTDEIKFTYDSIAPLASFDPSFRKFITASASLEIWGEASEKIQSFSIQNELITVDGATVFKGLVNLAIGDNVIAGNVIDLASNSTDLAEITITRINRNSAVV